MRPVIIAACALLLAAPLVAQRKINEQFPTIPDGHIRVQLLAGTVRVTGWDRDSIVVRGVVYDTPNEKFAIHRDKTGVKLGLWDPAVEKAGASQLEVFVPPRTQVWVKTTTAAIVISNVLGGVDAASAAGSIELSGTPREINVETLSGAVTVDARSRVARVRTATGPVTVRGAIADASVVTVSGNVTVETGGIERGRFESIDGDIIYAGDVQRIANLDFVNHAGAVELTVPSTALAEIVVNAYSGTISNGLGVKPTYAPRVKGAMGTQETYLLNGGGAYISIRSFRGRVELRRK